MKQIALLIITLAFVPAVIAQKKTELRHCAEAKCTQREVERLVKAGAIPPLRPVRPCVTFKPAVPAEVIVRRDTCGPQHDRVSAGSRGCVCS